MNWPLSSFIIVKIKLSNFHAAETWNNVSFIQILSAHLIFQYSVVFSHYILMREPSCTNTMFTFHYLDFMNRTELNRNVITLKLLQFLVQMYVCCCLLENVPQKCIVYNTNWPTSEIMHTSYHTSVVDMSALQSKHNSHVFYTRLDCKMVI